MMKLLKTQKSIGVFAIILSILISLSGCSSQPKDQKIPVQVLILSKFEVDEMAGDFPGEAQYFYEEYLYGGEVYDINGLSDTNKLYYKNGVAMCILGQGKVNAALNTAAVLSDKRFDFSDAYILAVGCGGVAESYDDIAVVRLDQTLSDQVFELVENVPLETTERSVRFLSKEYPRET